MPRNPQALRDLLRAIALGQRANIIRALDDLTPWEGWREAAADAVGPRVADALMRERYEVLDAMEEVLQELKPVPAPEKTE